MVSGEMFRHAFRLNAPTVTMWPNSISFSKAAVVALNSCERVRIEVNTQKHMLLAAPITEKDKDNVRWMKNSKEPASRKIECIAFASQLYDAWGWRKDYAYRATGKIISVEKKVMLLFDFTTPESWKFKEKAKAN